MTDIAEPELLLDKLAEQLKKWLVENRIDNPLMVGIHTGGVWVAEALHNKLNINDPLASLNISFYRDDFSRIGVHPTVNPSKLPPHIDDRDIILVDDVLQSGRTIRAAMNELFDFGRPASITLVCLVDRSGRELPIQADIVGQRLNLSENQHIKLTGPEPLEFVLK